MREEIIREMEDANENSVLALKKPRDFLLLIELQKYKYFKKSHSLGLFLYFCRRTHYPLVSYCPMGALARIESDILWATANVSDAGFSPGCSRQ